MAPDETSQSIRLSDEVRRAVDLVKSGLSELQHIDAANDRFHVPMLLLANGVERLLRASTGPAEAVRWQDAPRHLFTMSRDVTSVPRQDSNLRHAV